MTEVNASCPGLIHDILMLLAQHEGEIVVVISRLPAGHFALGLPAFSVVEWH